MDYLDPLELCPEDPAAGEQVKTAVHALMLNPNDFTSRFDLLLFAFGSDPLNDSGESPVFDRTRKTDRELFELANQVAMAVCCHKLGPSIYKYDRYKHSLKSFIMSVYRYSKDTVYGYAKDAPGLHKKFDIGDPEKTREFQQMQNVDPKDAPPYHISTQWSEAVRSQLSKYATDFRKRTKLVRTVQVGGEKHVDISADGTRRTVKSGHHNEQLPYIELDMSIEECERALAALDAHQHPLKYAIAFKPPAEFSAAVFERFKQFYLEHSASHTPNQVLNRHVNLEIARLYLCEKSSLAEILMTLGTDYPERIAETLGIASNAKKPAPMSLITVRSRVYQNILPMRDQFMKQSESCNSTMEPSSTSEAKEGSSACSI